MIFLGAHINEGKDGDGFHGFRNGRNRLPSFLLCRFGDNCRPLRKLEDSPDNSQTEGNDSHQQRFAREAGDLKNKVQVYCQSGQDNYWNQKDFYLDVPWPLF